MFSNLYLNLIDKLIFLGSDLKNMISYEKKLKFVG